MRAYRPCDLREPPRNRKFTDNTRLVGKPLLVKGQAERVDRHAARVAIEDETTRNRYVTCDGCGRVGEFLSRQLAYRNTGWLRIVQDDSVCDTYCPTCSAMLSNSCQG